MSIVKCPNCQMRVIASSDGCCPSCKSDLVPTAGTAVDAAAINDNAASSMTFAEHQPTGDRDRKVSSHFDLFWMLFSWRGRLSLGLALIAWGLALILPSTALVFAMILFGEGSPLFPLLLFVCFVVFSWSPIAIGIKRFHDLGWPGWLILIGIVPGIGPLFLFLTIGMLRGNRGANVYGEDPRRIWSAGLIDGR